MERTTFRDPRVIESGKRVVLLKADVTASESAEVKSLMADARIRGSARRWCFSIRPGKEHVDLRQAEYTSADELLDLIKRAHQPAAATTVPSHASRASLANPF